MILGSETELHIKQLQAKHIDVEQHNFVTSSHVEHMRQFPQQYTELVGKFLSKVDAKETEKEQQHLNI